MLESKSRCWNNIFGYCEADMTKGLIDLCSKWIKKDMIGVEVGSFAGVSSEVISNFCFKLTCVDPWVDGYDRGYREISREKIELAENSFDMMLRGRDNIEKVVGFSLDVCKDFDDGSLDFVYIDGAHDYNSAYADIVAWRDKVKVGGLVMGHDKNLIEKVLKDLGIIVVEQFCDTSWVSVKN